MLILGMQPLLPMHPPFIILITGLVLDTIYSQFNLQISREREFSPLKNASAAGKDCVDTVRKML